MYHRAEERLRLAAATANGSEIVMTRCPRRATLMRGIAYIAALFVISGVGGVSYLLWLESPDRFPPARPTREVVADALARRLGSNCRTNDSATRIPRLLNAPIFTNYIHRGIEELMFQRYPHAELTRVEMDSLLLDYLRFGDHQLVLNHADADCRVARQATVCICIENLEWVSALKHVPAGRRFLEINRDRRSFEIDFQRGTLRASFDAIVSSPDLPWESLNTSCLRTARPHEFTRGVDLMQPPPSRR